MVRAASAFSPLRGPRQTGASASVPGSSRIACMRTSHLKDLASFNKWLCSTPCQRPCQISTRDQHPASSGIARLPKGIPWCWPYTSPLLFVGYDQSIPTPHLRRDWVLWRVSGCMAACCAGAAGAVPVPCGRLGQPSALGMHHCRACLAAQQVPLHAHATSPPGGLHMHGEKHESC